MATLYITEYLDMQGTRPVPHEPPLAEQTVVIGGSSAQSAAFGPNTHLIRVHADSICSVLIGGNPTVTTSSARMAANQTEYRGVSPGQLLAVIANT